MKKMRIIACDFDGTLCENIFPKIGNPKIDIIEKLKQEQKNGSKIILWTCRENELLKSAVIWCEEQGLIFDAINDNLEEIKQYMSHNTRKVYATEYWDDKSISIKCA